VQITAGTVTQGKIEDFPWKTLLLKQDHTSECHVIQQFKEEEKEETNFTSKQNHDCKLPSWKTNIAASQKFGGVFSIKKIWLD
jgi:hypothetical protein